MSFNRSLYDMLWKRKNQIDNNSMKKAVLSVLLLFVALSAFSQTRFYRLNYSVDPTTGERKSYSGSCYVTFTRGGESCYESDKDGFAVPSYGSMQFVPNKSSTTTYNTDWLFKKYSTANGIITYRCEVSYTALNVTPFSLYSSGTSYYFVSFSTDFKRINIHVSDKKIISGEMTYAEGDAPVHDLY